MRKLLAAAAAAAALTAGALASPALAQPATGTVTVVHGIPNLPVDIYVNDALTLPNFTFKAITDPLTLPAATYNIKIRAAGAAATDAPALQGDVTLPAGANASIIAHLDEGGSPRLTTFVNDMTRIPAGQARVVVRHTAAAPAVDILVNGSPALTNLANPNETKAAVPAGTYQVAVAPTGTTTPVLGPVSLDLRAGNSYIVYAVGSASAGTLDLAIQIQQGLGSAPTGVPSGTGGLADQAGFPMAATVAVLAALGLMGSVVALRRTR